MSFSSVPNVIVAALFFGAMAIMNYLQNHFGELGIPPLYAPIAAAILTAIYKAVAEWQTKVLPTIQASPRGIDGQPTATLESTPEPSYAARVLYK